MIYIPGAIEMCDMNSSMSLSVSTLCGATQKERSAEIPAARKKVNKGQILLRICRYGGISQPIHCLALRSAVIEIIFVQFLHLVQNLNLC